MKKRLNVVLALFGLGSSCDYTSGAYKRTTTTALPSSPDMSILAVEPTKINGDLYEISQSLTDYYTYMDPMPAHDMSGFSTIFGTKSDKWKGGPLACTKKHPRPVNPDEHVCAHRTLPCGTILVIENPKNHKRTWCAVMDRGPYGAYTMEGGVRKWVVKKRPSDPGVWRGILDITPAAAVEIGHSGFQQVKVWKASSLDK